MHVCRQLISGKADGETREKFYHVSQSVLPKICQYFGTKFAVGV